MSCCRCKLNSLNSLFFILFMTSYMKALTVFLSNVDFWKYHFFPQLISPSCASLSWQDTKLIWCFFLYKNHKSKAPSWVKSASRERERENFTQWIMLSLCMCMVARAHVFKHMFMGSWASGHPETLYFGSLLDQGVTVTASSGCSAHTGTVLVTCRLRILVDSSHELNGNSATLWSAF